MKYLFILLATVLIQPVFGQLKTQFELSDSTETATYAEAMAFYYALDSMYNEVSIVEHGLTDIGIPLHVVLIHSGSEKLTEEIQKSNKVVWLINNAIHPGEPDGVSASQMFARDILEDRDNYQKALEKVIVAIIPFYNIGGALNRNSTTRVNQNGPLEYGFRGNSRHYDLNRDFIKSDTKNAQSFQEIFHQYDPDFLLDTHTSNGSDYQHTMTLVYSQKDKLGGDLGDFLDTELLPFTYQKMKEKRFETVPYVNAWGKTPDHGWPQFVDWPRYSTGYAALFHTPGYMSETHMLKSFSNRVQATYDLMVTILQMLEEKGDQLSKWRAQTKNAVSNRLNFEISWKLDTSRYKSIRFSGYEPTYVPSEISGLSRLKYDRNRPFTKQINFMDTYEAEKVIKAPKYYVIPKQWEQVIALLQINQVEMTPLNNDTSLLVEAYELTDFKTVENPYEGHYRHFDVVIEPKMVTNNFNKGDMFVPVNQWRNRYIVETLEPEAPDSFFSWNFFDAVLQQKEHFSAYVFENEALKILDENPEIKHQLEQAKLENPELKKSTYQQLDFIYQRSPHREPAYLRYPIFRVVD